MKTRAEEYLELKRNNKIRLTVTLIASVIVVLFSYLILKPESKNQNQIASQPKNAPTITIVDQNTINDESTLLAPVKLSKTSSTPLSEEEAFKLSVFQSAVDTAKKIVNVQQPPVDQVKERQNSAELLGSGAFGYNLINELVPLVTIDGAPPLPSQSGFHDGGGKKVIQTPKATIPSSSMMVKKDTTQIDKPIESSQSGVGTHVSSHKSTTDFSIKKRAPMTVNPDKDTKPNIIINAIVHASEPMVETKEKVVVNSHMKSNKSDSNISATRFSGKKIDVIQKTDKGKLGYKAAPVQSSKPTGGRNIMTVQVASLSDPIKAQALKSELTGKGYPARVERFKNGEKTFYRVRVGIYNDKEQVGQVVSKLKSLGYSATISR